ncbi:metalloregulator ArsR/SmtB family transcription factor [Pseudoroseomonas cervicalis]|uniref:ArsR/SmtB family transcription factor n=1 Tax=Teichococcus cervicalis TaxID=204525 RepID=UPI00278621CF|nr:metalloregulator ArsR/SmtB family transcription factor [Pseudoroseomonas cervicalis]MDQ1081128.1 SAM-dependent methyltransferase [Pseudoroseomonas cervicalis]
MEPLLAQLRAAAEPTRLRLLALCARGAFCVSELCAILGQSQPRLSRHLKLLVEAGLLERLPEGANVYFQLPPQADLVRLMLARLPEDDTTIAADRRAAARIAAERARAASEAFRRDGADWDEMRALDLPAAAIEAALLDLLPERLGRVADIGTGTGRLLELLAPRAGAVLGLDASREMLALARARLGERALPNASVRLADMYRLPLPDGGFDAATLQMVLHYAEDPAAALAEAARILSPEGLLVVIDLASHARQDLLAGPAHRWPGFDDAAMAGWLGAAGCAPLPPVEIAGPLPVRLWPARRLAVPVAAAEPVLTF